MVVFWVITILFLVSAAASAQPDVPIPLLPKDPALAPIDGGLGLLAAAGGAYAWKKLRNRKD